MNAGETRGQRSVIGYEWMNDARLETRHAEVLRYKSDVDSHPLGRFLSGDANSALLRPQALVPYRSAFRHVGSTHSKPNRSNTSFSVRG